MMNQEKSATKVAHSAGLTAWFLLLPLIYLILFGAIFVGGFILFLWFDHFPWQLLFGVLAFMFSYGLPIILIVSHCIWFYRAMSRGKILYPEVFAATFVVLGFFPGLIAAYYAGVTFFVSYSRDMYGLRNLRYCVFLITFYIFAYYAINTIICISATLKQHKIKPELINKMN